MKYFFNTWVLGAVALTALNDHLLKEAYPGVITGKISDFTGLFFFPFFLCALIEFCARIQFSRRVFLLAQLTSTLLFLVFKYESHAREFLTALFEEYLFAIQITPDPTDLVALIALPIAYLLARRYF